MNNGVDAKVWIFLIIVVIYILYKVKDSSRVYICRDCGYRGTATRAKKGNIIFSIILWCCFIIPGLIYSIFRAASVQKVCRNCGHASIIPADSPILNKEPITLVDQIPDPVKRCPACAEIIKADALKCRYCGERF